MVSCEMAETRSTSHVKRRQARRPASPVVTLALATLLHTAFFQATVGGQSTDLTVTASFVGRQVTTDEAIQFDLSRVLENGDGSIAVVIGQADLTSLFTLMDKSLRYDPSTLPLPTGESEVTLYLLSARNEWKELARFTLRVGDEAPTGSRDEGTTKPQTSAAPSAANQPQKRARFDKLDLVPSITLNINSQPAQSNFPGSSRPSRATFTTVNLQASLKSEADRGLFASQTQFDFVGSSFQAEALRFGQLGDAAPQVDLSSYLMQFKIGRVRYQSGHYSFGSNRHLINGFSSRGLMLSLPLGSRGDFALSAMNGTSIVGYGNFFGLDKSRHRLLSATLGIEFLPKRPGGLRVETTGVDAWLQPVNGFSQASVNDAERSRGLGVRLLATDPAQRFRLDTGFARSRFTSPLDPLVAQGLNLEPFPTVTRNARYLDASYDILRAQPLTKDKSVNLAFGFRTERVDPLYRSLGASTQADKLSNEFSLTGSIGEINTQFSHTRFSDNLNRIPSILRSLTRANTFLVGLPTSSLFAGQDKQSPLWPRVSYSLNRTHQFGAGIPVRGGFEIDPGSIPDQLAMNHTVSADWQIQRWRVGYRFNHSVQDNRQAGRERDDLATLVNGLTIGVSPAASLDLNFDLNTEGAHNRGAGTIDRTVRLAPVINWRMSNNSTLASSVSVRLAGDEADTRQNRNVEADVQWSCQFGVEKDRFRKMRGQFFIRYANRYARSSLFGSRDFQKTQILNLGLSITLF